MASLMTRAVGVAFSSWMLKGKIPLFGGLAYAALTTSEADV